jgi:hypothetical protein
MFMAVSSGAGSRRRPATPVPWATAARAGSGREDEPGHIEQARRDGPGDVVAADRKTWLALALPLVV